MVPHCHLFGMFVGLDDNLNNQCVVSFYQRAIVIKRWKKKNGNSKLGQIKQISDWCVRLSVNCPFFILLTNGNGYAEHQVTRWKCVKMKLTISMEPNKLQLKFYFVVAFPTWIDALICACFCL